MASGKNFVCSLFCNQGWISLDADKLVHAAIQKAEPQILATFLPYAQNKGIKLTNDDGSLNRRELGRLIFPDPSLLQMQEQIVYPIIIEETKAFIASNAQKNIIINATVLYKTPELLSLCKCIVYVTAPRIIRFFRARKRDNMPFKQILSRFKSQKKLFLKYEEFNIPVYKLTNTGNKTEKKVLQLIKFLK